LAGGLHRPASIGQHGDRHRAALVDQQPSGHRNDRVDLAGMTGFNW